MGRSVNALISLFNTINALPKLIVMVLEMDLTDDIKFTKEDRKSNLNYAAIYDRILKSHISKVNRCIAAFKENLPSKADRKNWPIVLWIAPVKNVNFNDNVEREIYGQQLEQQVKFHNNHIYLELKQVWSKFDRTLFCTKNNRFTADGFKAFWMAVDRTIKYGNTVAFKDGRIASINSSTSANREDCGYNVAAAEGDQRNVISDRRRFARHHHQRHHNHGNNRFHWRSSCKH